MGNKEFFMKKYSTYLFDMDGTLLDTNELIYQSFVNTCRVHGNMKIAREEVNKHIGIPLETQLTLYLGKKTEKEMDEIVATHQSHQEKIYKDTLSVFPGVVEGLKELKKRDVKIGIVSSRTRPSLDRYLKYIGIFDFFTVISTPESTTNHKPHPEPVLWALSKFNSKKEDTIFIGDATFDIESGYSAGVDTAFVIWSNNHIDDMKVKPNYILNSFNDLL